MPVPVPMQVHGIPNFCGGRILTNFFYYEENQFEAFFKNIIAALGTTENKGNLGMIVAFTNQQQKVAAGFLERIGFKPVATTDKYGNYNREKGKSNGGDTSPCVTFTGDWYHDVLPKIKEHFKELEALRTTAATTSNLRRPAAPATPIPPQPQAEPIFREGMNVYLVNEGRLPVERRCIWRIISPSARGANFWCAPVNFTGDNRWIHHTELRSA